MREERGLPLIDGPGEIGMDIEDLPDDAVVDLGLDDGGKEGLKTGTRGAYGGHHKTFSSQRACSLIE